MYNRLERWTAVHEMDDECLAHQHVTLLEDLIIRYNRSRYQLTDDFNDLVLEKCASAVKSLQLSLQENKRRMVDVVKDGPVEKYISCQMTTMMKIVSTPFSRFMY